MGKSEGGKKVKRVKQVNGENLTVEEATINKVFYINSSPFPARCRLLVGSLDSLRGSPDVDGVNFDELSRMAVS